MIMNVHMGNLSLQSAGCSFREKEPFPPVSPVNRLFNGGTVMRNQSNSDILSSLISLICISLSIYLLLGVSGLTIHTRHIGNPG